MTVRDILQVPECLRASEVRSRKRGSRSPASFWDYSWARARIQELALLGVPAKIISRRGESPCVCYSLSQSRRPAGSVVFPGAEW